MIVYLSGGIDLLSKEDSREWRSEAAKLLSDRHISSFDPAHAWTWCSQAELTRQKEDAQRVIAIDLSAVDLVDGLLVRADGAGIGTFRELERAITRGTPVVAYSTNGVMRSLFWMDNRIITCTNLLEAVNVIAAHLNDRILNNSIMELVND
jgi:nucleoside 2-deoxyribosyltransferase